MNTVNTVNSGRCKLQKVLSCEARFEYVLELTYGLVYSVPAVNTVNCNGCCINRYFNLQKTLFCEAGHPAPAVNTVNCGGRRVNRYC